MEEAKPVVLTKPVRGREMLSKKGPLEKIAPVGAIEQVKIDKKRVETYYEGYVDGQLFLVPDSNLEAMKDMINFKMRPKTSIRYKHQTSYDIQYYDQFTEKLNELLSKIDDFQDSGDFETTNKERQSSDESIDKKDREVESEEDDDRSEDSGWKTMKNDDKSIDDVKSKIEKVKSEIIEELENEYVEEKDSLDSSETSNNAQEPKRESELSGEMKPRKEELSDSDLGLKHEGGTEPEIEIQSETEPKNKVEEESEMKYGSEKDIESKNKSEQEIEVEPEKELEPSGQIKPEREMEPESLVDEETDTGTSRDELRFRFLISGHFKDGTKPVYLVQEYDGKNNIFKDQKIDFTSNQENSNTNVFISGKLYAENILVISEGKPLVLNTKPQKIVINEEKCKIFDNSFKHIFEKENHHILLKGKFIKGKNDKITPSLSFCVKEKTSVQPQNNNERNFKKYETTKN